MNGGIIMRFNRICLFAMTTALYAQPALHGPAKGPFQAASTSQIDFYVDKDKAEVIAINNVNYELTGSAIPGRPPDDRLVLRKSVRSREVVGDIGMEATTTVEAWPFGVNMKQ